MKAEIHPNYTTSKVRCGCGEKFETGSTIGEILVEICSKCHPFYTGKQKFVDTAGRVEKFRRKYDWKSSVGSETEEKTEEKKEETQPEQS